jgi:uncharacterized protein YbaR (Trm112 family)
MHTCLVPILSCPECGGALRLDSVDGDAEIEAGGLLCAACGRAYPIEGGIPILAPRDTLDAYADRWSWVENDGLARELLVRMIEASRQGYEGGGPFATWIDYAAKVRGLVLDIATGPGSSLLGALAPLLTEETHLIATDASLRLLTHLKSVWAVQRIRPSLDFFAMDGNRWPLRDGVLDAVTSRFGFGCVWDDPERQKSPRHGNAYREAARTLKRGGRVFDACLQFAPESETCAVLEADGSVSASRARLEAFWCEIGFEIEWAQELRRGEGKMNEGDLVPYGEHDVWWEMLYVLRKIK